MILFSSVNCPPI